MSVDERLRSLERAWRERGELNAGAAWLRERERVGTLSRPRLELAAHLGDAAARAALGLEAEPGPEGDRLPARLFAPDVALPLSSGPEGRRLERGRSTTRSPPCSASRSRSTPARPGSRGRSTS